MRILVFSVGPVFPDFVHGGSQRVLRELALYLGRKGHDVTILCTQRPDNDRPFALGPHVDVKPTLRLRPTYPEPYYTAPYNIVDLLAQVHEGIEESDVLYIHDGELPFHFLYSSIPTVVSFRDFVYPDTLVGAFGFKADHLILASTYVADCVRSVFSRFLPNIDSRITVIPNGIDLQHFRPRGRIPKSLLNIIGRDAVADVTLLYPHRPDPRKGLFEVLEVTAKLKPRLAAMNRSLKLLVPVWVDSGISDNNRHQYQAIYQSAMQRASDLGIESSVHLHGWIPFNLLPYYYSLGSVTLSIGSFVEAFGNVVLESIACGTPSVTSHVGALANKLPQTLAPSVPYGLIDEVVAILDELMASPFPVAQARDYLMNNFPMEEMLIAYERLFCSVKKETPLNYSYNFRLGKDTRVALPAWCRFDGIGLYHDYQYGRIADRRWFELAKRVGNGARVGDLLLQGYTECEIESAIKDGILTISPK